MHEHHFFPINNVFAFTYPLSYTVPMWSPRQIIIGLLAGSIAGTLALCQTGMALVSHMDMDMHTASVGMQGAHEGAPGVVTIAAPVADDTCASCISMAGKDRAAPLPTLSLRILTIFALCVFFAQYFIVGSFARSRVPIFYALPLPPPVRLRTVVMMC